MVNAPQPRCLVIHSSIDFKRPISYPSPILIACSVAKLGTSSITWSVAVFEARRRSQNENEHSLSSYDLNLEKCHDTPSVSGQVVHGNYYYKYLLYKNAIIFFLKSSYFFYFLLRIVYVNPVTEKSVEIPQSARQELENLLV